MVDDSNVPLGQSLLGQSSDALLLARWHDDFAATAAARRHAHVRTDAVEQGGNMRNDADLATGRLELVEYGERAIERCGIERAEAFVDQQRPHTNVVSRHRRQ